MLRSKKENVIKGLQELFQKSNVGILTDYRGLSAPDVTGLRRKLREKDVDYKVIKNTLARVAARRAGREELASVFDGPVAVAFSYDEVTEISKLLVNYVRDSKTSLTIKGGFIGDKLLSAEDVISIAMLPSREVLLARVVGGMQSPIVALVRHLVAPLQSLVGVLNARRQQLEGG